MKASSEVILCEGLIDAMTFWCAGFSNVISACGCNGFTADHLAALRYHCVKRVLIAFDRDEAGDLWAESVAGDLLELWIEAWRVYFPQGLDANAYALKSGNPEKALEQAAWMGHGTGPGALFSHETPGPDTPSSLAALLGVPSSPLSAETAPIPGEVTAAGELLMRCGPRIWRVRSWQKNTVPEVIKVAGAVCHHRRVPC